MSSGSEQQHSSSPKKEHRRSSSRSRSRERKADREHHRDRDRKIKIKVPELTVSLYNFKHFCNLQIEKVSSETLQKAYDRYKKDWQHRQNQEFIKEYKKDAWFSEKYDPEVLDLLERDRKDNCKNLQADFISKMNSGYFDKIDLTARDPNDFGIVEKFDDEEQHNSGLSYVLSQAYDVHVSHQTEIHNSPYFGYDQNLNTLFIKSVPRSISRYDIRSVFQKLEGYKTLTMSDPVKKMNLTRYCWVDFQTQESCNKALLTLSGLMIKDEAIIVTKSTTKMKRIKILKNYPISRRQKDTNTMGALIKVLDEEVGIENNELLLKEFEDSRVRMDLFLLYLRKVHSFDYFTCSKYENQRILALKVSSAFLRIEADYEELEDVQTVFKKIQQKAEERIAKGSQIKDYMGILRDQIEAFICQTQKVAKGEQKEVWKCLYCDKKFKTCEFLSKHMIVKHEEIKFKKIQSVMQRLYLQDPQKITFNSLIDREQRFKKPYNPYYRRDKRRQYRDFDEPEPQKSAKPSSAGGKQMINFLDI